MTLVPNAEASRADRALACRAARRRVAAVEAADVLQPRPLAQGLAQQLVEAVVGGVGDGVRQGAVRAGVDLSVASAQHLVGRLALQQRRAVGVVEDGEARRHAGLQREALQQALAERVDGLHLEAARRLDGDGEQRARALASRLGVGPVEQLRELPSRARVVGIVTHCASVSNTRFGHLGGSGLGVGEARMRSGCVPASSRRSTRMVSTCVLPVPALALTQAEALRIGGVRLAASCASERR